MLRVDPAFGSYLWLSIPAPTRSRASYNRRGRAAPPCGERAESVYGAAAGVTTDHHDRPHNTQQAMNATHHLQSLLFRCDVRV